MYHLPQARSAPHQFCVRIFKPCGRPCLIDIGEKDHAQPGLTHQDVDRTPRGRVNQNDCGQREVGKI